MSGIQYALLDPKNPVEVKGAAQLCAEVDWNIDENLVKEFQQQFPLGSFIAKDGNNIIGYFSSTVINEEHGFIGNFVINEEYRGKGIGSKLFTKGLEALEDINVSLFATPQGSGMYKKKWNFKECSPRRFFAKARFVPQFKDESDPAPDVEITTVVTEDFESLLEYDTSIHTVERRQILHEYVKNGHCLLARDENGKILGYTIIERMQLAVNITPLYAEDPKTAKKLLKHAVAKLLKGDEMQAYVPFDNAEAIDLFKEIGFTMDNCPNVEFLFTKDQVNVPLEKIYSMMNLCSVYA